MRQSGHATRARHGLSHSVTKRLAFSKATIGQARLMEAIIKMKANGQAAMHQSAGSSTSERAHSIAIIGLGPRGASLVERLGANLAAQPEPEGGWRLELHLIDDAEPGPGRIWRTDQTRELCMNTLAHAVTLFTEPGSTVAGPVTQGPTLYEWCILASARDDAATPHGDAVREIPAEHAAPAHLHPARTGLTADYRDELAALRPESHPSRALYGEYLSWFFHRAIALLPPGVNVTHHRARAVSVTGGERGERIMLDSGTAVHAGAVIAATGWLPRAGTRAELVLEQEFSARAELTWVRQGSPIEQDLSAVLPGEHVIVRGLGMSFFDTMALLSLGRGGRFTADPTALGGLRYTASGAEPILHVTSHRGVPFRAKSRYGGLPPRPPQTLLREPDWRAAPRPINFDTQLWPRIVGDAFLAHASTLRTVRAGALGSHPDAALAALEADVRASIAPLTAETEVASLVETVDRVAAAAARHIPDPCDRFDLASEIHPAAGPFSSPGAYTAWVTQRVASDLAEADLGSASPLKAGLWSISSARGVAARIGTLGGFDAESRNSGAALLTALGGMVGSGPPAFRNSQLLALASAGLVHFIGPGAPVSVTDHGVLAASPAVSGSAVTSRVLIDAWMHFHDSRASTDSLTRSLLDAGRAQPFEVISRFSGAPVATAGLDVDSATGRLIGSSGVPDRAFHITGIPVEDTLHGTVISPLPGADAMLLRETDRASRSALNISLGIELRGSLPGQDPTPAASALTPHSSAGSAESTPPTRLREGALSA